MCEMLVNIHISIYWIIWAYDYWTRFRVIRSFFCSTCLGRPSIRAVLRNACCNSWGMWNQEPTLWVLGEDHDGQSLIKGDTWKSPKSYGHFNRGFLFDMNNKIYWRFVSADIVADVTWRDHLPADVLTVYLQDFYCHSMCSLTNLVNPRP